MTYHNRRTRCDRVLSVIRLRPSCPFARGNPTMSFGYLLDAQKLSARRANAYCREMRVGVKGDSFRLETIRLVVGDA